MDLMEASVLLHICLVLFLLWLLSSFNCCPSAAYFISLIYLYLVHEGYVTRLRRKIRFEERRHSNQRRVLTDSESVRWLNYAVDKIWPVCMEQIVSQKILLPIIPWFLQKYKPWTVNEAVIQHLYMGRSPPMFTAMRVLRQSTGDDHLVLELGMNFRTADDMSAILAVKVMGVGMWVKIHLMGMHVEGKVLVGVKFLRQWPFLGRLRVCFVEPPYFQMTVKPLIPHGLNVTELPGIDGWLDKLLAVAFEQTLVEPNMLVVDMEKFVSPQQEDWFTVDEKEPVAYALVEIIEGADMKPSDLNGLADPYAKGQLGLYRFRTKTERKTLAPKWHEEFKVPIWTWESPNVLAINVGDKDPFLDDALGDCSITIGDELRDGQRHDMWLPLQNIKTGRLHLAITVVEGNTKVPGQPYDSETLNVDHERNSLLDETAQKDSLTSGMSMKSSKVADKFEPIDIEGQEETGIWVHHPGSEVSQIWEPRKGKSRLNTEIPLDGSDRVGSFKLSASRSYNDGSSSSDESQEGNKIHSPNKMMRGFQKIGSIFHRKSRKEDASRRIEELLPSPHANLKAVNAKEIGVKLVVDGNLSLPTSGKVSKEEGTVSSEGSGEESPSKRRVRDKAKGILKHAGKSIKHTFSGKGSKNFRSDSGLVVTGRDISSGSEFSDEGSLPFEGRTSGSERIPVVSKPISGYDHDSFLSKEPDHSMNIEEHDVRSNISEKNDDLMVKDSSNPKPPEAKLEVNEK